MFKKKNAKENNDKHEEKVQGEVKDVALFDDGEAEDEEDYSLESILGEAAARKRENEKAASVEHSIDEVKQVNSEEQVKEIEEHSINEPKQVEEIEQVEEIGQLEEEQHSIIEPEQVYEKEQFNDTADNEETGTEESNEDTVDTVDKNDYVLYVIIDKPIDGMLDYFRNAGLNVSRIFSSIKEARDTVLMQIMKSKMIVVDTGTGQFTNMTARAELIDLLGIGDDENKVTVFYSDSVIRSEVGYSREVEDKQIEWVKYQSTAQVVAYMLSTKKEDNYIKDSEYSNSAKIVENLRCRGVKVDTSNTENAHLGECQINTSDIISKQTGDSGEYKLLEGYVIEL